MKHQRGKAQKTNFLISFILSLSLSLRLGFVGHKKTIHSGKKRAWNGKTKETEESSLDESTKDTKD